MWRSIIITLTIGMLCACGGRVPVEVIARQVGDEEKGCAELEMELEHIEKEAELLIPARDKTVRNLGLLALTTSEPLAVIFMDLSLAEKRELSALKKRYNHLVRLALQKECGPPPKEPETLPENFHELMQSPNPSGL